MALQVQVPAERVTAMAFSPDGSCLAAATWAGCIFLYSRRRSMQTRSHLAAVAGETGIAAAETSKEGPHSQDTPASLNESCQGRTKAGPDEALSRLAWIEHGSQGVPYSTVLSSLIADCSKPVRHLCSHAWCAISWHGKCLAAAKGTWLFSASQSICLVQAVFVAEVVLCHPFPCKMTFSLRESSMRERGAV